MDATIQDLRKKLRSLLYMGQQPAKESDRLVAEVTESQATKDSKLRAIIQFLKTAPSRQEAEATLFARTYLTDPVALNLLEVVYKLTENLALVTKLLLHKNIRWVLANAIQRGNLCPAGALYAEAYCTSSSEEQLKLLAYVVKLAMNEPCGYVVKDIHRGVLTFMLTVMDCHNSGVHAMQMFLLDSLSHTGVNTDGGLIYKPGLHNLAATIEAMRKLAATA